MRQSHFDIERICASDPRFALAKRIEFELFGIHCRFATLDDIAKGEMLAYRPFEAASEFYVAWTVHDRLKTAAGIIRLIRHVPSLGLDSFSTIHDARRYGHPPRSLLTPSWEARLASFEPSGMSELASQAIHPSMRRRGAIDELWLHIVDTCLAEGVTWWSAALTVPLFRFYHSMFPTALVAIGDLMPQYVGADSLPVLFHLDHIETNVYRERVRAGYWSHTAPRSRNAEPYVAQSETNLLVNGV
jgi:hypothetical protein